MPEQLRLMCVLAHPDDESLGNGGMLARYAAEGVETYLVTATRGERGWLGPTDQYPGPAALGAIREGELRTAAAALGIREVAYLDYMDGDLDRADSAEATAKIVAHLRRVQPHVVVTFGSEGGYGHPDHIAISQLTTAACVAAADARYRDAEQRGPHRVAKLYYMAWPKAQLDAYEAVFGTLEMPVDGVGRRATPWPEWAITTWIDTADYQDTVWRAIFCHTSQVPLYSRLQHVPEQYQQVLWRQLTYYRVFSLVNGGRAAERDLFAGLR
jgi:LmbE family N-acetylglucosaminyl deacetylase